MKKEQGVAVIMAMWLLAVLAMIGTTFVFMTRLEPIIARTHRDDMKAHYIAQAGIDHAVYILKQDVGGNIDHLGEAWADGFTDEVLFDEAGYSAGYYTVEVRDESGKTNLNTAPKAHLEGLELMDYVIVDPDYTRADALIDYRGTYGLLETIDELLCVRGISETVFDRNREIMTVYTNGLVNLNTASYSVLVGIEDGEGGLLGGTDEDVYSIIDYRNGVDNIDGTADDNVYETPYSAGLGPVTEIANVGAINEAEAEYLTGEDVDETSPGIIDGTTRVSIKSQGLFTIISTGKYVSPSGQETQKKLRIVVNREKVTPAVESRIEYYKEEPED